jgi:hypothetical protein
MSVREVALLRVGLGVDVLHVGVEGEFTPEQVFVACNRVEDLLSDLDALPFEWQRLLRRTMDLETAMARSMSVGDWFTLCSPSGRVIARYVCDPVGWTVSGPEMEVP